MSIVKDTPASLATDDSTALLIRDSIGGRGPRGRWRHIVPSWEGIRRIRGVEVAQAAIGIGAITALSLALPGALFDFQPHPLLLLVLAISIRYGNPSGWVAGSLAAFSYAELLWLRPHNASHALSPLELIQPVVFLVTGALTGGAMSAVRGRAAEADRKYEQVFDLWRTFYERHMSTVRAKVELEKRLVIKHTSTATLCECAKRLQTLRTDELYRATLDVTAAFLDARKAAVYLSTDGLFQLAAGLPAEVPGRPSTLSADVGPAAEAMASLQVVMVPARCEENPTEASTDDFALMAGPLLGVNGRVLGVVVVEELQPYELSPSAALCFEQILNWASLAFQNSCLYEGIESGCAGVLVSQDNG